HTATPLPNGRVLGAGAEHAPDDILASAEIYDPDTGKWTATGSMISARWQQFAVGLGDGRVLVAGGIGPGGPLAELYEERTGTWTATGDPISSRAQRGTAVLLGDGTVLLAGGDGGGDHMLATGGGYDPAQGRLAAPGNLSAPRRR